jgi:hypothetical protein
MAGASSYLYVIGRFLPNQACQPIIYGMPGGVGDFRVHGGNRSRLIMRNTLWREVIPAAGRREAIYINVYTNKQLINNSTIPDYYIYYYKSIDASASLYLLKRLRSTILCHF